jgi:hypothetical protein
MKKKYVIRYNTSHHNRKIGLVFDCINENGNNLTTEFGWGISKADCIPYDVTLEDLKKDLSDIDDELFKLNMVKDFLGDSKLKVASHDEYQKYLLEKTIDSDLSTEEKSKIILSEFAENVKEEKVIKFGKASVKKKAKSKEKLSTNKYAPVELIEDHEIEEEEIEDDEY